MKCVRLCIAAATLLAAAGAAQGAVVNGGFETGDFTGWTTSGAIGPGIGDVVGSELTRDLGPIPGTWLPTEGNFFASLWSTDSLGTDFSQISQSFAGAAGDTLSFDWFFDFGDFVDLGGGPNDFASATIAGPSGSVTLVSIDGGSLGDFGDDGWNFESYVLPSTGAYTLTFHCGDTLSSFESLFGIDDVRLRQGGPVIPLPTGVGLAGAGLALIGARRRR